jgi:hypothetical protein
MTQTTKQVLQQQAADADRDRQQKPKAKSRPAAQPAPQPVPATTAAPSEFIEPAAPPSTAVAIKPTTTLPAMPDNRTSVQRFLDEEAPNRLVGCRIDFDPKEGEHVIADTGDKISSERDFLALCPETLIEWIKFNGEGVPPTQIAGLLYDGFELPPRDTLGDNDKAQWPIGLSGKEEDPWKRGTYIVLQDADTHEFFMFVTRSKTGRIAAANLLRHYERLRKSHPGECPVVRLKVGGFEHKDTRVGWVKTPVFVVVGHSKVDPTTRPDTSLRAEMDDEIPFN